MSRLATLLIIWLVFNISALDLAAKYYAVHHFPLASATNLRPILDFALHKNPGIAFDIPIPFFIILPLTLVICFIFGRYAYHNWLTNHELALASLVVIIGATNNLLDRALNGFTTDYILLFRSSAINLADVLIILGMLTFLWYHKSIPSPS